MVKPVGTETFSVYAPPSTLKKSAQYVRPLSGLPSSSSANDPRPPENDTSIALAGAVLSVNLTSPFVGAVGWFVNVQSIVSPPSRSNVTLRLARSTVVPPSGSLQEMSVTFQP